MVGASGFEMRIVSGSKKIANYNFRETTGWKLLWDGRNVNTGKMIINLKIKPLSDNKAWQGKRFKTPDYKKYEIQMLRMLPDMEIKEFKQLKITYGFSNMMADIDNPTKLVLDILQKRYNVNDRDLIYLVLHKVKTKKGEEFIEIELY